MVPEWVKTRPELVDRVLCNWGANDAQFLPGGGWSPEIDHATWVSQYGAILDYLHGRFPNARLWVMRPWRRGLDTQCATLSGWIDEVLSTRSAFASAGPDEAIWLKADDNGLLETDAGGVHYTALGNQLCAEAWATALGY